MTSIQELQSRVRIAEAYHEGEQIELCEASKIGKNTENWRECDPGKRNWDWKRYVYRVKP